jgi:ankyrin repeat protein
VPLRLEEVDCSSVHEAVRKDHFACFKLLLAREPASALQLDEHGETALHCIDHCRTPHCHAVTAALLSAQPRAAVAAVINSVDRQQRTALQLVEHKGGSVCHPCLQALCAAGADARTAGAPTADSYSKEHYSMNSSLVQAVLRSEGSARDSYSTEQQLRRSAAAAVARITASLRALQQAGLDVNADDCFLHMCAAGEYTTAVTALLACGADVHKGACSWLLQLQLILACEGN